MLARSNVPQTQDVIFEAGEDLFSNSSLVLTKGAHKRISISRNRTAQSYIYEFCGMVGVSPNSLRFTLESRPLDPDVLILSPTIVKVNHITSILHSSQNSLQPALLDLLTTGVQSDVSIIVNNKTFRVHKCILMCRSPKFRAMLSSHMIETESDIIILQETDEVLFEKLLQWIYSGSVVMPDDINDVCKLMLLADEYILNDLKMRCEEDMVAKLCPENLVEILIAAHKLPLTSESLVEECLEMFVKEYQKVKNTPQLEEIISSVPGLMTKLFARFHSTSKKAKKRRVTFRIDEDVVDTLDDVSLLYSGYSSTTSSYT
jgi:speckle-type POZ protein